MRGQELEAGGLAEEVGVEVAEGLWADVEVVGLSLVRVRIRVASEN